MVVSELGVPGNSYVKSAFARKGVVRNESQTTRRGIVIDNFFEVIFLEMLSSVQ